MSEFVADASASLAYIQGESGEKKVAKVREQCVVATTNLVEAFSKLVRSNMPPEGVQIILRQSFPRTSPLDRELAEAAAILHASTRDHGLSYGDCVCLSLGSKRKATVLTADKRWKDLDVGVNVELIR